MKRFDWAACSAMVLMMMVMMGYRGQSAPLALPLYCWLCL